MKEKWKMIEGYPDYWVSDCGRVKSYRRGKPRILRQKLDSGYLRVTLFCDGKEKKYLVHRLVALAFCGGYEDNLQVDHINGDKLDNRVENLRCVSHALNQVHQQKARSKTGFIGVYRMQGNLAKPFRAEARVTGKYKYLGCFSTAEEASAVRDDFVRKRFSGEELTFYKKEVTA